MNTLSDEQRKRILDLLSAGKALRRIEDETGHRRETIAAYGRRAGLLDGGVVSIAAEREPASMFDAHADVIRRALAEGSSLREIHARLKHDYALTGSYSALKRYVRVREIGSNAQRMLAA